MMTEDYDLTSMQAAEPILGRQVGHAVLRVHPRSKCEGRDIPCCIHDPSGHHMRAWEMNWRGDRGIMERVCPHGIGHPDPDDAAYRRHRDLAKVPEFDEDGYELNAYDEGIHGCDGCCREKT
jgi:hypothetical protein